MSEEEYVSKAEYDRLRADYEAALTEALEESETLKAKVAELEPFQKQASDMTAKARSLEAARAFDRIAKELKVRDEFKDDVFKLADFQPKDGQEVDEKAVREHFAGFLKDRPQYTEGHGEPAKFAKGEGAARGATDPGFGDGKAKERVTHAQLSDYAWTSKNADLLADPGKYEIVEA